MLSLDQAWHGTCNPSVQAANAFQPKCVKTSFKEECTTWTMMPCKRQADGYRLQALGTGAVGEKGSLRGPLGLLAVLI